MLRRHFSTTKNKRLKETKAKQPNAPFYMLTPLTSLLLPTFVDINNQWSFTIQQN